MVRPAGLQRQALPRLIAAHLIGAVGHQARHVGPPGRGLRRFRGFRSVLRRLFGGALPGQQILPQGHGGRGGADLLQEPVVLPVQHHHQGTVILCRDLQEGGVAGLPHLVIARHHRQQGRKGRVVGRVRQALPGIDEVARQDPPPVRPLCAAQLERPGDRAVGVLLRSGALGHAVGHRGAGGAGGLAHQVLIQMDQDRLVRRLCGVNGIQLLRRTAHADGEGHRISAPGTSGQCGDTQRRGQEQRQPPLPVFHTIAPLFWSTEQAPVGARKCQMT